MAGHQYQQEISSQIFAGFAPADPGHSCEQLTPENLFGITAKTSTILVMAKKNTSLVCLLPGSLPQCIPIYDQVDADHYSNQD